MELGAGKHIFFHTDGATIDILADLVDAGVDVFWASPHQRQSIK